MRRAYVVVGEREEARPDVWYAVVHSMKLADELCLTAENEDPERIYYWREVVEDDD